MPVADGRLAGGEDVQLVRPEVVVPAPDRMLLVQDGGDAGVLAGLPPPLVLLDAGRARQRGRQEDDVAGVAGHRQLGHVAAAAGHQPRLTGLRQQPQRRTVLGVVVRLRLDVRAAGGEQQPAVRQERRLRLARRRPGQPPRRPLPAGVDLPERGGVALPVRRPLGDRGDEPDAVGGEGQPAQPRERDVVLEVLERGTERALLRHERDPSSAALRRRRRTRGGRPGRPPASRRCRCSPAGPSARGSW